MITFLKNNYKTIFVIAFFILAALFLNQCDSTKKWKIKYNNNKQQNAQNIKALTDSITKEVNKAGQASFGKALASMSKEQLEQTFPDLYAKLKDETGEVKIITNTVIRYIDTGSVKNVIAKLDKETFKLDSKYYSKDSSVFIDAFSTFTAKIDSTKQQKPAIIISKGITNYKTISFTTGFTTGIKEKDGVYNIFLTPDSKNVTVLELKGADVSNLFIKDEEAIGKSKKFSVGPYLGYGAVLGSGNNMYHGISVGVAIQYSLFKF